MRPRARVTSKGQVTIRKDVRGRWGLRPGDEIADQSLLLYLPPQAQAEVTNTVYPRARKPQEPQESRRMMEKRERVAGQLLQPQDILTIINSCPAV